MLKRFSKQIQSKQSFRLYGRHKTSRLVTRADTRQEGHVLLLLKTIYVTLQAEQKWRDHISSWMERNGYAAVNSENTIFMKHSGSEYIIHGLFVDDMMHFYSCDEIKDKFMELYSKDFEITGGSQMKTFLGMQVEQTARSIKIHFDHYIKAVMVEYAEYIRKAIQPKKKFQSLRMSFSSQKTPLIFRISANRISIALSWQSFSLQQHGSDSRNNWPAFQASRSRIAEARAPPTCCLAMLTRTRIAETAVHGDQRLIHSCCTTRR
jgi:hypothetical protein